MPGPRGCTVPGGCPAPVGARFWGVPGPQGGSCSRGGSAPWGVVFFPACTEADPPPPGETATAADGTHSTGMHSCTCCCFE